MLDHATNLLSKRRRRCVALHILKQQLFGAPGTDNVASILGK